MPAQDCSIGPTAAPLIGLRSSRANADRSCAEHAGFGKADQQIALDLPPASRQELRQVACMTGK